jgi:hypothetical protein
VIDDCDVVKKTEFNVEAQNICEACDTLREIRTTNPEKVVLAKTKSAAKLANRSSNVEIAWNTACD